MHRISSRLIRCTVIYLLAPNLLFFLYWFRFPVNGLLLAGTGVLLYFYLKRVSGPEERPLGWKALAILCVLALAWTLLAGIGNLVAQALDFQGHNAKLYNLFTSPWPLLYEYNAREVIYYFSFYLVPAYLMKLNGQYSNLVLIVWSWSGYMLVLTWAFYLLKRSFLRVGIFLALGESAVFFNSQVFRRLGDFPQHEWPVFMGSLFEQSSWVPNQFLPTLLVLSIFIHQLTRGLDLKLLVFPLVLSLTWGVFPAIGMAVVIVTGMIIYGRAGEIGGLIMYSLRYLLLVIPVALFYQSSNGGGVSEFLFLTNRRLVKIPVWAGQIFPQVLVFGTLIFFFVKDRQARLYSFCVCGILLVFSMFRVGVYNDLVSRTSIVFFTVIVFYVALSFETQVLKKVRWLVPVLLIDVFFTFYILGDKLMHNEVMKIDKHREIYRHDDNKSIYEYFKKYAHEQELIQYSSKEDSFYQKYLANH